MSTDPQQLYVVELEPGVWLATGEGDPARTLVLDNAKAFTSEASAARASTKARTHRAFKAAKIYGANPLGTKRRPMAKKNTPDKLAERVCDRYGSHVTEREKDLSRHGFMAGWNAGRKAARPSRKQVMAVLDRVLEEGGYKLTVRAYNSILTGLGYRLGKYTKE